MGRKENLSDDKKEKITIYLPKWMINKLRKRKNYSNFIFEVLSVHIKKDNFDEK